KDVALDAFQRPLGNQESVAVAMEVEASDGELPAVGGHYVLAATQLDQVAAGGQAYQRRFQFVAGRALRGELSDELLEVGAGMRQAGDVGEQRRVGHRLQV